MTETEINKTIADFMELDIFSFRYKSGVLTEITLGSGDIFGLYTKSLDALVPVWEKLGANPLFYDDDIDKGVWCCELDLEDFSIKQAEWHKSIQLAAATATALAINELDNER